MVLSRDLDLGKIFSVQFGPDEDVAMRVAVAGSSAGVKVWDLSTSSAARRALRIASSVASTVAAKKASRSSLGMTKGLGARPALSLSKGG